MPREVPGTYFWAHSFGSIIEVPDTGALSDYVTAENPLIPMMQAAYGEATKPDRQEPVFVHVGCHQEDDLDFKKPLVEFFKWLTAPDQTDILALVYSATVSQAGNTADLWMVD